LCKALEELENIRPTAIRANFDKVLYAVELLWLRNKNLNLHCIHNIKIIWLSVGSALCQMISRERGLILLSHNNW